MGKKGKRTKEEILNWKKSYLVNKGIAVQNLQQGDIESAFKRIRGEEVSKSSGKKNKTMLQRYGKKSLTSEETITKGYNSSLKKRGIDTQNLSDAEAKQLYYSLRKPASRDQDSYRLAIINKGKLMAEQYGIDTEGMNNEELSKLSGLSKRRNYAKKSKEEKNQYRRNWKITILRNFYGNIVSWEDQTDLSLKNWYHKYLYSTNRLKEPKNSYGKTGWYDSEKIGRWYYRSSYEHAFLIWAEKEPEVTEVQGHLPGIGYVFEGCNHYYFPDFKIMYKEKSYLVEIKAKWMLVDPLTRAKLGAGEEFASNNHIEFIVITEDHLEDIGDRLRSKER